MSDLFESKPIEKTQTQTQSGTTTQQLTPEQQKLLELAMGGFSKFSAKPPQAYTGTQIAGFNPTQKAGQEMVLDAAGQQQGTADVATAGHQFLASGDVLRPESNPALAEHASAAVQPLYQNLAEVALPNVRGGAYTTGGFGGSRQGIAEGLATGRTAQAAGATTADIYSTAYGQGLDAMGKGLALTPTVQAAQTQPGLTTSGVGDVRQGLQQAILDRQVQDYYFNQFAPFMQAKELASIAGGLPGGSTTTQGSASGVSSTPGAEQNPLMTGIGAVASLLPLFI